MERDISIAEGMESWDYLRSLIKLAGFLSVRGLVIIGLELVKVLGLELVLESVRSQAECLVELKTSGTRVLNVSLIDLGNQRVCQILEAGISLIKTAHQN